MKVVDLGADDFQDDAPGVPGILTFVSLFGLSAQMDPIQKLFLDSIREYSSRSQ